MHCAYVIVYLLHVYTCVFLYVGENNTHCSFLSCDVNCADQVLCAGTDKTKDDSYLLFW